MTWTVASGDGTDRVDLGDIAFGEPELVRRIHVENSGDSVLLLGVNPDSQLYSAAERIAFLEEEKSLLQQDLHAGHSDLTVTDSLDHDEDENLLFHEFGSRTSFQVQPHSTTTILLFFRPRSGASTAELQTISGSVIFKNQSTEIGQDAVTQKKLLLRGRVCTSVIRAETTELTFSSCEPLQKYVKDFTVRNLSEIPTVFRLRSTIVRAQNDVDSNPLLEYADYETGATLSAMGGRVQLDGFSHRRLRVSFQSLNVGEVDYMLDIDNVRNVQNTLSIRIITSVSTDVPIAGLEVSCGDELDFGDRYVLNVCSKKIWLRNVHDQPLHIKISSDLPSQLAFELAMKDDEDSSSVQHLQTGTLSDLSPSSQVSTAHSSPKSVGNASRAELPGGQMPRSATSQPENAMESKEDAENSPGKSPEEKWYFYRKNSVEEISISPGQTRWLRIWYMPTEANNAVHSQNAHSQKTAGTLQSQSFRLLMRSSTNLSKTIFCRARVCESIVTVKPKEVNLGDCNVQSTRSTVVRIYNHSDLTAFIAVRYVSKCVTASVRDMVIAPQQWYDLLFNYVPRKVNPEYEKQITIVNLKNRKNDSVFVLRANVVDKNRVSIHALFYKVLAPTPTNEIDMGKTVEGYPAIKVFEVRNVTSKNLVLRMDGGPQLALFQRKKMSGSEAALGERGKPPHPTKFKSRSLTRDAPHLSAEEGHPPRDTELSPTRTEAEQAMAEIIESLRPIASLPTYFAEAEAERSYVDTQLKPAARLIRAIRKGYIQKVSEIRLESEETNVLFACFTPVAPQAEKRLSFRYKPVEEKLCIRLVEFDESILSSRGEQDGQPMVPAEIAPREVAISVLACCSELELAQRMLNFGNLYLGEQRSKSIVIHNKAEAPLLYSIEKTGSVASGDLRFDLTRHGVVRPYSSKEIPFVFSPSLAGTYHEVVKVRNLLDSRDIQTITVKAEVHRKSNYHVDVLSSTDFGDCSINEPSEHVLVVRITNDSEKSRKFTAELGYELHGDESEAREGGFLMCKFSLDEEMLESPPSVTEDIASLEEKAAAYKRKGKISKAEKALEQAAHLKLNQEVRPATPSQGQDTTVGTKALRRLHLSVRAREQQIVRMRILPSPSSRNFTGYMQFGVYVYETKNRDQQETIHCNAKILENNLGMTSGTAEADTTTRTKADPETLKARKSIAQPILFDRDRIVVENVVVGASPKDVSFRIRNKLDHCMHFQIVAPKLSMSQRFSGGASPPAFGLSVPWNSALDTGAVQTSTAVEVDVSPRSGDIAARREEEITLRVSSNADGKHIQSILVKCEYNGSVFENVVNLVVNSLVRPLIEFIDAKHDGALDLGRGTVHPSKTYAIEKRALLMSLTDKETIVKGRSNLSSQVFVFDDNGQPLDALRMEARGRSYIRICVAPNLHGDELLDGSCRTLIGGLHFAITARDKFGEATVEQTVKFTALVGLQLVEVDRKQLIVGAVPSLRAVLRDHFSISNRSLGLECRIRLSSSSPRLRLSRVSETLAPGSTATIHTALSCESVGLSVERVRIRNQDVPSEELLASFGAFVDPQLVQVEGHELGTSVLPMVDDLQVYVIPTATKQVWSATYTAKKTFKLLAAPGRMTQRERCFFLSPLPFSFYQEYEGAEESADDADVGDVDCSFPVREKAFWFGGDIREVCVALEYTDTVQLTAEQSDSLLLGRAIQFSGNVFLTSSTRVSNASESRAGMGVIKALQVNGSWCRSRLRVATDQPVNFGFIGHVNGWMSVVAEIQVENMSALPTQFEVGPLPPELEVIESNATGDTLAGFGMARVRFMLNSSLLRDHQTGEVKFEVPIRNCRNLHDEIRTTFSATVTAPWLSFDRLSRAETWQLVIPPLTVPGTVTSDGWFRVTNVGDQAMTLEFSLDAIVESFENLFSIAVTELASGSPLRNVTLSDGESIAIRVIASVLPQASQFVDLEEAMSVFTLPPGSAHDPPEPSSKSGPISSWGFSSNADLLESKSSMSAEGAQKLYEKGDEHEDDLGETRNVQLTTLRIKCRVGELEEPHEVVKIYGSARPGPSVSVSPRMLTLMVDGSVEVPAEGPPNDGMVQESVSLANPWHQDKVKFSTEVVGLPPDLEISLEPSAGELAGGEKAELKVSLKTGSLDSIDHQVAPLHGSIYVYDVDRPATTAAIVGLAIAFGNARRTSDSEEAGDRPRSHDEPMSGDARSPKLPILEALSCGVAPRTASSETHTSGVHQAASMQSDPTVETKRLGNLVDDHSSVFSLPVSVTRKPRLIRTNSSNAESLEHVRGASTITLKGCSALPGGGLRYETNVGQVTVGKRLAPWKLTLETEADINIEYKIHRLRSFDNDQGWFLLSRNGGILERGKLHNLDITFTAEHVGVYSTYLLIENRADASDLKTIRVSMEVVADGGAMRSTATKFFSVLCDGGKRGIEYSIVTFDHVYRHRSFFICNHSDIEMEFLLTHDVPPRCRTEVNFSSTNATLRKVSSLVVNPHQKRRVFLYFLPRLEQEDMPNSDSSSLAAIIVRKFNIYINCRLVKDYQETVEVTANCKPAQLSLSRADFLFDLSVAAGGQGSSDVPPVETQAMSPITPSREGVAEIYRALVENGEHLEETLEVRNLIPSELDFCVRNDSLFFTSIGKSSGKLTSENRSTSLTLRLNVKRLLERLSFLVKEKYVEEHISIYNRQTPEEYYWVRLRISFGGASEFSAVMHSRAYTFSILEELVVLFLQKFSVFWSGLRRPRVAGAGADSVEIAIESAGGDSDSVQEMLARIREKHRSASTAAGMPSLDEWFASLNATVETEEYRDLLFEMHYVTDELVYFALRHGTGAVLRIATALFSFIFKHNVFLSVLQADSASVKPPQLILPWAGQLRHFLSYFPDKADHFTALLMLEKKLSERVTADHSNACHPAAGRLAMQTQFYQSQASPSPGPSPSSRW